MARHLQPPRAQLFPGSPPPLSHGHGSRANSGPPRILAAPQPCLSELLPHEEFGENVRDGTTPQQGHTMVPIFTRMTHSLPPP